MSRKLLTFVSLAIACALVAASCSSDQQVRNASLITTTTGVIKAPKITAPKISLSPTTTVADPRSEIDGSQIEGVELSGVFTTIDLNNCLADLYLWMRDESKGSEFEFSHAAYLTELYYEYQVRNGGTLECEEPATFWQEVQDWVSKLVHKPLPTLKLTVNQFAPWDLVSNGIRVIHWEDRLKVDFPRPEPGTIWAIDIDPVTRRGTPWILDHLYRRVKKCGTSVVEEGEVSTSFTVKHTRRDTDYVQGDRFDCYEVSASAFGVTVYGEASDHVVELAERRFYFRPWIAPPDKFVVIGFGDSYGSGEGSPGSSITYEERASYNPLGDNNSWVDSSRYSHPESLFWPEGRLAEFEVNTWGHDDCHRSSQSGIAKAVQKLAREYTGDIMMGHFACSGAKLNDIAFTAYQPDFFGFERWQPTQVSQALDWLAARDASPSSVDAIVISGGGNDAHFSSVIKDCFITPGECHDEDDEADYMEQTATVVPLRMERLTNILLQVFPNAKIFFTAYTDGISVLTDYDEDGDTACSEADDPYFTTVEYETDEFWDIAAVDARWVRTFENTLNRSESNKVASMYANGARLASDDVYAWAAKRTYGINPGVAAGRLRVYFIDSHFWDFKNNGFCTKNRRNITFNDQAIRQQGNDQFELWSSGGWHPNDFGYQLYGDAISDVLATRFPMTHANLRNRR